MKVRQFGEVEAICVVATKARGTATWVKKDGAWQPIVYRVLNDERTNTGDRAEMALGLDIPKGKTLAWATFVDEQLRFTDDVGKFALTPPPEGGDVVYIDSYRRALSLLFHWGFRRDDPAPVVRRDLEAVAREILGLVGAARRTGNYPTEDWLPSQSKMTETLTNGPVEVVTVY